VTLRVTDADGRTATAGTTISVVDPMVLAASNSDAVATVGQPFSRGLAVVGGQSPYGYALASGTLPPGLSLSSSTGTIAGTPSQAGTFGNLSILVTDAEGRTATTGAFVIDVRSALAFAGVPSQIATVGISYDSSALVTGGALPYAISLASGTLPAGLSLDSATGRITGTPTTVGTASGLQLQAVDQGGRVALSAPFPIDVRASVTVAGTPASAATISAGYGPSAFNAAGGRSPYTYAMVGSLPAGLSLSSAGSLSGTPTAAGTFPGLQVKATDADGRTGTSSAFAITVSQPLAISGSSPATATVGTTYAGSYTARNGQQPYVYSLVAGNLPTGLSLDASSGQIAGTPSGTGSYPGLQVRVTDADGRTASAAAFTLTVSNPLSASADPGPAVRSSAYSTQVAASGGRAGYAYALVAGTLPAGLTLGASTGTISGTPTTAQVASGLQVRVTDADGRTALTAVFAISVAPPLSLSLANPIQATIGTALAVSANPAGGRSPYVVSLASGSLPAGISLDAGSGAIAGTTWSTGTFPFGVTVVDADGRSVSASSSMVVQNPVAVGAPNATDGIIGSTFTSALPASGGSGSYTFALVAGTLPPGVSLNTATGSIGGTPNTAGTYQGLQVRATDAVGRQGFSPTFALTVDPTMSISGSLANGSVGSSYLANIVAQGGRAPYAYALAAGTLPTGLTLDGSTGAISGMPTAGGTYTGIQVRATDALGRSAATASLSMQILAPLAIAGAPTAYAVRGTAYSSGITGTGGRAPYAFSVISGNLPSGLVLSSTTGAITGTPTVSGASFAVRLQDADGRVVVSPTYTITVSAPLSLSVTSQSRYIAQGDAYAAGLTAAGGAAPYSFSISNGYLPEGLSLTSTGAQASIAGTPSYPGPSDIPVTVRDAGGRTATVRLSMMVAASVSPGIGTFRFVGMYDRILEKGRYYNTSNPVVGGQSPYKFTAPNGLPAGLTLDPNTGTISGTSQRPYGSGDNAYYNIYATDAVGRVAQTSLGQFYVNGFAVTIMSMQRWATLGRPYPGAYIQAYAPTGPYTFNVTGLPPGLTASQINGETVYVTGTPDTVGAWTVSCTATDRNGTTVACSNPLTVKVEDAPPTPNDVLPISAVTATNPQGGQYQSLLYGSLLRWDEYFWNLAKPVFKTAGSWVDITFPEPVRANAVYWVSQQSPGGSPSTSMQVSVSSDLGGYANAKYGPSGMWEFDRTIYGSRFRVTLNSNSTTDIASTPQIAFGQYPKGNNEAIQVGYTNTSNAQSMTNGSVVDIGPAIGSGLMPQPWLFPSGFRWALKGRYPLVPGLTFNPTTGRVTGTVSTAGAAKGLYEVWVYGTDDYGRVWDTYPFVMNNQ